MTSMKTLELAYLGTNRSVPLIGHETLSYLMLARTPWTDFAQKGPVSDPNAAGFFASMAETIDDLLARLERYLERKRLTKELESLDDRILSDIGLDRAGIAAAVDASIGEPRPSLLRRAFRFVRAASQRRAAAMALHALSDSILRDIGLERGQINAYVAGEIGPETAPAKKRESGGDLVRRLVQPLRQWNVSRHATGDMVRIDSKLLTDIGYVKGDVDWVPEVLTERHLNPANVNGRKSRAA